MNIRRSLALIALPVCAGCMAPPPAQLQPVQARIAEANARAAARARAGDDSGAVRQYEEALRLARSIEDADAIAASAINLSIVYQWLGRAADARERLSAVLDDERLPFTARRRTQAELRRAIVDLAARDAGSAAAWIKRAEERCARTCELEAAIVNVRAQMALDGGRPEEALQLAQRAAEAARVREDRAESANALRSVGRARRALGDPEGAIRALQDALALDRALADPRKILADLVELGRASAEKGDREAARGYFERALAVSRAARDAGSIEEMAAALRALEGAPRAGR